MTAIDRYQIISELGRGGMATVYLAHDPRFGRDVAIKILPRELLHNPLFRERFEREARAIARIEHSAIVPVHDYGEDNGQPFLVMRYMPGGSLADRIARQGALPLEDIRAVLDRVAAALDAAHRLGIIHRDVKPANILFDSYGEAYLSDFGIVKLSEGVTQLTGSVMVGTPAYTAPEMAGGDGITPLVDVYALGVTLFQMLTGRLPYEAGSPLGMLMAHVNRPVPDVRLLRPGLPDAVQAVIERALAKKPGDRYQSAGALAEALRAALQTAPRGSVGAVSLVDSGRLSVPEEAEATVPDSPAARPVRRWPRRVAAVLLLLALLVSGLLLPRLFDDDGLQPIQPVSSTGDGARSPLGPHQIALNGVSRNADWEPYTEQINGVLMALVPAGCFQMGSTDDQITYALAVHGSEIDRSFFEDEQPAHHVCFTRPFWIDVYEVTNEQYGSTGCAGSSSQPDQPRNCVSWNDALAHCQARGARLPTEAEWEYAARGPDALIYPWGDSFDCSRGSFDDETRVQAGAVVAGAGCDGFGATAPVGSFPDGVSWVGAYDLSGNLWEWVNDWYDSAYYSTLPDGITDPRGPSSGTAHVLRGGSWYYGMPSDLRSARRNGDDLSPGDLNDGFRCALSYSP